jgi:hypothetical protein
MSKKKVEVSSDCFSFPDQTIDARASTSVFYSIPQPDPIRPECELTSIVFTQEAAVEGTMRSEPPSEMSCNPDGDIGCTHLAFDLNVDTAQTERSLRFTAEVTIGGIDYTTPDPVSLIGTCVG